MTPLNKTLLTLGLFLSLATVNAQRGDGSGNPSSRGNNQGERMANNSSNQQRNANRQENVTMRNARQNECSADCTGTGVPKAGWFG